VIYLFTLIFFAIGAQGALAATLDCARSVNLTPGTRAVGVETIHRIGNTVVTVLLPLPKAGGRILDLNAMKVNSEYPERFAMSDGTLQTAFVEIDLRPKSNLRACVEELAERAKREAKSKNALVELMKDFLSGYLDEVPEDSRFPWDPRKESKLPAEFRKAADLAPGHFPLETGLQHPSIGLDAFLKQGKGACLPKVMLTSLVMKELGLPHRVRTGGSDSFGHMWIELPDGRHLDPTWRLLMKPSLKGTLPGWFRFDQTFLFENDFFPVAED
jgi:hypothetical protein